MVRSLVCKADSFKGPGGLSAREIMSRMHEAEARDKGVPKPQAQDLGRAAAEASASQRRAAEASSSQQNASKSAQVPIRILQASSAMDLVQMMVARGVDFSDCAQPDALLSRAIATIGEKPSSRPKARHHPAYQRASPDAHLKGTAVDRSAVEKKDWLDN